MSETNVFEAQPAIVELYGRQVIAGMVTEEEHLGTTMLRVDVPEVDGRPAFTKFYGSGAIYGITPIDEVGMLAAVERLRARPISVYVLPDRQLPAPDPDDGDGSICPECGQTPDYCCCYEDEIPL